MVDSWLNKCGSTKIVARRTNTGKYLADIGGKKMTKKKRRKMVEQPSSPDVVVHSLN